MPHSSTSSYMTNYLNQWIINYKVTPKIIGHEIQLKKTKSKNVTGFPKGFIKEWNTS